MFEEKHNELLSESAPHAYQQSIATVWNVSLDHVERTDSEAIQLLQVCAYLAPEPIPRDLFSQVQHGSIAPQLDAALADPLRLGRAIREIRRYSLARVDLRTNSIQIHRLVQGVLISRMTPHQKEQMKRAAQLLLASADPRNPESSATWKRYSVLYPHALAAASVHSTDPRVHRLVLNIATYLQRWGDHESALRFTEAAYESARELFGPDDEKTLALAFWLGWILFTMGRYKEAAKVNKVTLAAYESVHRPSRIPVAKTQEGHLDAMGAVAADLRVKGDFSESLALTRRVYEQARAAFGEDDPSTLNAAHNLAVCLRLVGRFQDAYDLDCTTWELKQELLGSDHELTLLTRVGLAIDERELGRYADARNRQEEVVAAYERQFPAGNAAVLHSQRVLAVARRSRRPPRCLGGVARGVGGDGKPVRAGASGHDRRIDRPVGRSAARRAVGPGPGTGRRLLPSVSTNLYGAASARCLGNGQPRHHLAAARRPLEAYELDLRAYAALSEKLGERHPLTLVVATNQASDLAALERHEEALALGTETLALCTDVLGRAHPSTLCTAANRALDLHALNRNDECDALHSTVLDESRRQLSAAHPAVTDLADLKRANCHIDPLPL